MIMHKCELAEMNSGSKMYDSIVFDLDGTIIALTLPLDAMRADVKKFFIDHGLPPELLEPADGISSSTVKAREFFLNNGMSKEKWDELQKHADLILSAHESSSARNVRFLDGVLEALQQLKSSGFKTAILTNNGREAVNVILQKLPLSQYFDVIQTRNESKSPKPFPDGLLQVIERLGSTPDRTLYVGDARIDAAAARRAGVDFWGVVTGETPEDALYAEGAKRVFPSLTELIQTLLNIAASGSAVRARSSTLSS